MTSTLTKFANFLEFKEYFISDALNNAIFFEKREHENCRPLVKLSSVKDLVAVNKNISKWSLTVNELVNEDPTRFNPSAAMFIPLPKVILEPIELLIRKNMAVSTRKVTKEQIVKRLERNHSALLMKNNNFRNEDSEKLKKEIFSFKERECDTYRLRSIGYPDYIILYKLKGSNDVHKTRMSKNGTFFYDPRDKCRISYPNESQDRKKRSNSYLEQDVPIVHCSLYDNITAFLIKESDAERVRQNRAATHIETIATSG